MRRFACLCALMVLFVAPAYGDLFVLTVGDVDAMVDATFTSLDTESNLDALVYTPGWNPWDPSLLEHPQVNDDGWIEWELVFDPDVPVEEINGATLEIYAWDVDVNDYEVVSIGSDAVSYVLGGLNDRDQGGVFTFVDGVTSGGPEYGTLGSLSTSFTLTDEQASNLFGDSPSATVRVDLDTSGRAIAVDYAIITIDYTPGASEPVGTPEPASMIMLGALGAGLAGARKLRKKR